jgi:hypothetical protein
MSIDLSIKPEGKAAVYLCPGKIEIRMVPTQEPKDD